MQKSREWESGNQRKNGDRRIGIDHVVGREPPVEKFFGERQEPGHIGVDMAAGLLGDGDDDQRDAEQRAGEKAQILVSRRVVREDPSSVLTATLMRAPRSV